MRTFLFDIDGTLLRTGGAGLHAMRIAMQDLFGVESMAKVEVRGRTDRGILRDLFAAHDIVDSPSNFEDFQQAYLRQLPTSLKDLPGYLLPGVESTLAALSQSGDSALGLLTGNSRRAAKIKLTHFAVDHLFLVRRIWRSCHVPKRSRSAGTAVGRGAPPTSPRQKSNLGDR